MATRLETVARVKVVINCGLAKLPVQQGMAGSKGL